MRRRIISVDIVIIYFSIVVILSQISEFPKIKLFEYPGIIYTNKDIYIDSFGCGYISNYEKLNDYILIIETEEQLAFAEKQYYLSYTERIDSVGSHFQEMKSKYSLDEYTYVLDYDEVSSTGYHWHADRLNIKNNQIFFLLDKESYSPEPYDIVGCAMGGFFHMAAVPKQYLQGQTFINVQYPSINNMKLDNDYKIHTPLDISDEELYHVYGDNKYIIRNQAEYDSFLAMAKDIQLPENTTLLHPVDFNKVVLLITCFTRNGLHYYCNTYPIEIDGTNIFMDYEIINLEPTNHDDPTTTCMICAHIPKRFITEENYDGWIIP